MMNLKKKKGKESKVNVKIHNLEIEKVNKFKINVKILNTEKRKGIMLIKNYRMFIHKKTHTKSVCLKHLRDK